MVVPPVGGRILMECRLRTAESFRGGVEPAWTLDKAPRGNPRGADLYVGIRGITFWRRSRCRRRCLWLHNLRKRRRKAYSRNTFRRSFSRDAEFTAVYGKHTGRLVLDNGASRGCLKRAALNDKGAASPARYISQRKKPPARGGLFVVSCRWKRYRSFSEELIANWQFVAFELFY